MSSWAGFTDRLRRHGRGLYHSDAKTTQGYLNAAADRIEDLESKLYLLSQEHDRAVARSREARG